MNKIIIASDSFKGSVSSMEVAMEAEQAVLNIYPQCEVLKVAVADGGEGTTEALVSSMGGSLVNCNVTGPLQDPVVCSYGLLNKGTMAVIEMASASGLTLIPEEKRNPMLATSYGTGQLIKDALFRGCEEILIGIGGSATNDGGTGMLQALGFRFLDEKGKELGVGGQILELIHYIDETEALPQLQNARIKVACDVHNPFYGINGAAHVFAGQKGADEEMILLLDKGLRNFSQVIQKKYMLDVNAFPGSGAAGGLGGALIGFLKAEMRSGIELVLETIAFDKLIEGADLIITGEGKFDRQTSMGKTPFGILQAGSKQHIPVIALGGSVENVEELNKHGFLAVLSIQPYPVTIDKAMEKEFTRKNIRRVVEQQLRIIKRFRPE